MDFPAEIFVSGTDTEVGKSLVAAALMMGINAAYWKPVQSGDRNGTDTEWIQQYTALPSHRFFKETYRFREPVSPHAAAALEGVEIELKAFKKPSYTPNDHLIIEGAGGLLAPLGQNLFMVDLIKKIQAPVLLVARSGLGTINHTLLSLEKIRKEGVPLLGVVMNGPPNADNRTAIEQFGKVKVLGEIPPLDDITPAALKRVFYDCININ